MMTGHARISIAAWGATVLGALVLTPVFSGPFLFVSAFLCALITGVGVGLQNLRIPRIVVPIVQLLALIELLSLFFLPAIGYIVLLSAEGRSRLSRWGRRISGVSHLDAAEPVEASALGQAGRRIGLTVVAIAALLPALLPTLPEGVIGNGLAGGSN